VTPQHKNTHKTLNELKLKSMLHMVR